MEKIMKDDQYIVAGYCFTNAHDYREAKREEETVEYIKANTDLSDLNKTIRLYHKLVERRTLKSVVGFAFLQELRDRILKEGIVSDKDLPAIRVMKEEKPIRAYASVLEKEQENKHLAMIQDYQIRLRNSRIINISLLLIILAMLLISIFSDRSLFADYEQQVLDTYSSWEEDLNAREKALEEKESQIP